jgi:hypothetical protein
MHAENGKIAKIVLGRSSSHSLLSHKQVTIRSFEFEIPNRVWSKKNVSYSHLRVFECKPYVHIPKEHRSKLDDKATPYIFLSYGNEEFQIQTMGPTQEENCQMQRCCVL